MDPILVAAVRQLMTAQSRAKSAGVELSPADQDAFISEETKGKYGLSHAQKLITSIDTDPNALRNIGRSLAQGATFGWGDEILGKLPKFLGGGPDAEAEMRLRGDLFKKAHPFIDATNQVVGGIGAGYATAGVLPEVAAGGALLRGVASGAAAGAASGAGNAEGDVGDRAKAAVVPAVLGGGIGAILPGLGKIWANRNPAVRAATRLTQAIKQEGGVPALRAKAADFAAAGRGDETMLMDLGDHLRSQADFAATNSQDVAVPLAQKVRARQADASDRLLGDANELLGGDLHAPTRANELKSATAAWAAGPAGYGGLRDAAPTIDVSNIAARLNKPGVKGAWNEARLAGDITENSPLDQMLQKLRTANPTASEKDLKAAATLMQKGATNADTKRPVTFDDLLQMKRALDGKVTAAYKSGNGSLAKAYSTVRDEIAGGLTETVPAFAKVESQYAARKGLERALDAGQEAFDQVDTRGLANQVAMFTPEQLEQFRYGAASKMLAGLRSTSTNTDAAKRILDASAATRDKLKLIFGDQIDSYMGRVAKEAELAKAKGPISGSQTASRLAASGVDLAELGVHLAASPHTGAISAGRQALGKLLLNGRAAGTARELGPTLMTQGQPAIDELLKRWASRPTPVSSFFHTVLPIAGSSLLH